MSLSIIKLAKILKVPTKDRRKNSTGSLNEDIRCLQVIDRSDSPGRSQVMHLGEPYNYMYGNTFNVKCISDDSLNNDFWTPILATFLLVLITLNYWHILCLFG